MEEAGNQACDEETGGGLSKIVCIDHNVSVEQQQGSDDHDDFLENQKEYGDLRIYTGKAVKGQGSDHQQLVCQGIHQFPEGGDLVILSCQIAVEHVGNAGSTEHHERGDHVTACIEYGKDRNQSQSDHGQDIGYVPCFFQHVPELFFHNGPLSAGMAACMRSTLYHRIKT